MEEDKEKTGVHDHPAQPQHPHQQTGWQKTKRIAGKVWHFLWHEDSVASWIANIIVAFIVIKFLFYPALGALLGTSYPIVAVVSGSMEHDHSYEDWWVTPCLIGGKSLQYTDGTIVTPEHMYARFNITKATFDTFSFRNGFNKGDLMILYSPKNVAVGDVLVYSASGFSDPIIHRVVQESDIDGSLIYQSQGDHNCQQNPFEKSITTQQVLGKAVVRIPLLGWIKIGFVNLIQLFMGRSV